MVMSFPDFPVWQPLSCRTKQPNTGFQLIHWLNKTTGYQMPWYLHPGAAVDKWQHSRKTCAKRGRELHRWHGKLRVVPQWQQWRTSRVVSWKHKKNQDMLKIKKTSQVVLAMPWPGCCHFLLSTFNLLVRCNLRGAMEGDRQKLPAVGWSNQFDKGCWYSSWFVKLYHRWMKGKI